MALKYGIYVPNCWAYASVGALVELARAADAAGWDGFFVWDHLLIAEDIPVIDSQIAVAAVAGATSGGRLERIGSLVTPLARRRPWKVARETAALQEVAGGRLVVGVGLGQPPEYEFSNQELASPADRGAALDDALELLGRFWSGSGFSWERTRDGAVDGREAPRVEAPPFLPVPDPVPPIWVAGVIHREDGSPASDEVVMTRDEYKPQVVERTVRQPTRPFRRAARYQGLFPIAMPWDNDAPLTPAELAQAVRYAFPGGDVREGFDVVTCGRTLGADAPVAAADLEAYEHAGATWWLEAPPDLASLDEALAIIRSGPPVAATA